MAILVDNDTRLVVQGLTGSEGRFHGLRNRSYGTNLVAGVTPGCKLASNAAEPATCGDAIEVPLKNWYVLPGVVLSTSTPGAARSTVVRPKFESNGEPKTPNVARPSERSVAATEMMPSSAKLDG